RYTSVINRNIRSGYFRYAKLLHRLWRCRNFSGRAIPCNTCSCSKPDSLSLFSSVWHNASAFFFLSSDNPYRLLFPVFPVRGSTLPGFFVFPGGILPCLYGILFHGVVPSAR